MAKSTTTYWNVLSSENANKWETIEGSGDKIEQLTLAVDEITGDYTRLTRFQAGTNTTAFDAKAHDYPEEVFIVSGRLYDEAFDT